MTMLTIQTHTPTPTPTETPQTWTRCTKAPTPALTTTVPREYVHRSSLAEVFLTGCEPTGPHTYLLTGQWPRAHTFFTSPDGTSHDPVQAGETIRQTGLYLCHAIYGVPLTHNVLLWNLDFTTHPDRLRIGPGPSDLTIHATCTDFTWKGTRFSGHLHVTIHRNHQPVAHGTAHFTCVAPAPDRRRRGTPTHPTPPHPHTPHTPIPPTTAGRTHPHDVVLAPTPHPHRWQLNPDLNHPILFEHTGDHHPGMVLIEAARQAAHTLHPPGTYTPTTITTQFHHYAELHTPCYIHATPTTPHHTTITGHQQGHTIFHTTLTTHP
ncbi:ScbA/BarX family gamma-butyrolactone biosynthesis protein [Streptomyces sp. NPDC002044]|uniref:ScbA/BarX family gamma-butyrolactone biosynthesis protein n=1 Tax=Streptomyces sp. NPDC002044 TaxID=3154662 RepID=UPI0033255F27